eukprot:2941901-Rhodomonas_salina.4
MLTWYVCHRPCGTRLPASCPAWTETALAISTATTARPKQVDDSGGACSMRWGGAAVSGQELWVSNLQLLRDVNHGLVQLVWQGRSLVAADDNLFISLGRALTVMCAQGNGRSRVVCGLWTRYVVSRVCLQREKTSGTSRLSGRRAWSCAHNLVCTQSMSAVVVRVSRLHCPMSPLHESARRLMASFKDSGVCVGRETEHQCARQCVLPRSSTRVALVASESLRLKLHVCPDATPGAIATQTSRA